MLKFGTISKVDATAGLFQVTFDEDKFVTDWIPGAVPNSKDNKDELPFSKGEHVACLMDNKLERGLVLCAIYDRKNAPPVGDPTIRATTFKNGSSSKVNTANGEVELDFTKVTMNGGENGGLVKSEEVKSTDDAIADDINALKQIFASWVTVPNDGGAALKAGAASWAGQQLIKKAKKDYENDKLLH